ncbi:MAG TPA: YrhK family protein [Gammaproteobacteria bacterium]
MLEKFVREYGWIHFGIGLIGNILFVVGSAYFMFYGNKEAGMLAFFAGSVGLLLGKIGEAVATAADHHWKITENNQS